METSATRQQGFQCPDCDGQKSTEKTIRCWDCALKLKKSAWKAASSVRADDILARKNGGMSMVEIARELGVSRQRLYQVVEQAGKTVKLNGGFDYSYKGHSAAKPNNKKGDKND